jgi:ABC-type polar amino acid transport system ATPase subunit
MEGAHIVMSAVLSVRDLRLSRGSREILKGITFEIARGEVAALMGLSGSGKTTILRSVAELEPEGRAAIQISGDGRPAPSLRRGSRLGMVFQFHFLFEHLTVIDNVCLAPVHVHGVARGDAAARATSLLDQLGIGHRASALPRELSGGEAQRAAIARALAMDPPLLLLDEPTASLDPPRRTSLGVLLQDLAAAGRAILVTSHDVDFVRDHATRVLILSEGRLVEDGPPNDVFTSPRHEATRALLQSAT